MTERSLKPCPKTPNCVSSLAPEDDRKHHIPAITFSGDPAAALEAVLGAIGTLERTRIVEQTDGYVHAVSASKVFRFKDDLEVLIGDGRIDVRSAARMGSYDFDVNRKRVEAFSDEVRNRLA